MQVLACLLSFFLVVAATKDGIILPFVPRLPPFLRLPRELIMASLFSASPHRRRPCGSQDKSPRRPWGRPGPVLTLTGRRRKRPLPSPRGAARLLSLPSSCTRYRLSSRWPGGLEFHAARRPIGKVTSKLLVGMWGLCALSLSFSLLS